MCENIEEFRTYVGAMLRNRNKIPAKVSYNGSSTTLDIESVQLIFCRHPNTLKGYTFGKDDYIVKVGSWYNISIEIQEEIVTEFMTRTVE